MKRNKCIVDGCDYPRWSRKTKMCRTHDAVERNKGGRPVKSMTKKAYQKIKQVSSKRANQNKIYSVMRRQFLKGKTCEFPDCSAKHTEEEQLTIHHKNSRRGEMLLDTRYWSALCLDHHRFITDNPKWAEENGFLIKGRNSK